MGLRVIIPVAGVGTRLRPHTHTAPKVMLQVAGKPMIGHILDELKNYDIEEITFIIGHLGDAIRSYVTRAYDFKFHFVTQEELHGLGHAIWMTGDLYRETDGPLLIILGDTIFDADFKTIIGSDVNWIGVREVGDPRRFGVVQLEGEYIKAMVEKPEVPPTNLAIVGIYYFTEGRMLFKCLDENIKAGRTTKGEFQLTDALQRMLELGAKMKPFKIEGWFDCGKPETLLETNRTLLAKHQARGRDNGEGIKAHNFTGSLLRPPVSIGQGVTIENSIIGPDVTLAEGAVIRNSIISDSIVSSNATVETMLLNHSIIADNAKVSGQWAELNVGDASEIKLG